MKKKKIETNKCYICKADVGNEFYLIGDRKICVKCYNNKHIASDVKSKAKRIFL